MRQYEDKQKEVVAERECVRLQCDLCGRIAEYPADELFEWGSVGTALGKLEWHYAIDGDYKSEELDLCYQCADALARSVLRLGRDLLALIGR